MIRYLACELHTHTQHSDGRFSVAGLCRLAKEYEFDLIALTDHNTLSGRHELTPELEAETVPAAVGIEWTTYFGHLLVIGAERFVDWRFATPDTIDAELAKIRAAGGTAGIVHPFCFDTPFCPGCRWSFNVTRWDLVDHIEVWNGYAPPEVRYNPPAFEFWTDLLNRGHRIAATAGSDWHGIRPFVPTSATYLGIEGKAGTASVRDALRAGRSFFTMGPVLDVAVFAGGARYGIGAVIPSGVSLLALTVDETQRRAVWGKYDIAVREIRIVGNGKTVASRAYAADGRGGREEFPLPPMPGWLRVELYGTYRGREGMSLLAATSPFYFV